MSRREKVENVFTPRSANVNSEMYICRPFLENELREKMRNTQHIIIYGESGCGKSWLYKKVLKDQGVYYKTVNLALASTYNGINKLLENLANNERPTKDSFEENINADLKVVLADAGAAHKNHYVMNIKHGLFRYLDVFFNKQGGFLCFDNLEAIFHRPQLMEELGNLIILLDDEEFASYHVKFIISGVPSGVLTYFSKEKNLSTISSRIVELPEVKPMDDLQTELLLKKGFCDKLKVKFKSDNDRSDMFNHIKFITSGIPQAIQEYSLILAIKIESNNWYYDKSLLFKADQSWVRDSLYANYQAIEDLMNSENTRIGRRNQVLYCLGKINTKSFTTVQIQRLMLREFESTSKGKSINISIPLGDIADYKTPFIKKKGNLFYITDWKSILCIRTILYKSGEEKVEKIDLSDLY